MIVETIEKSYVTYLLATIYLSLYLLLQLFHQFLLFFSFFSGLEAFHFKNQFVFMRMHYCNAKTSGYFHTVRTIQNRSLEESKGKTAVNYCYLQKKGSVPWLILMKFSSSINILQLIGYSNTKR